MPKSNVRFIVIWAALVPVLAGITDLLGTALHWSSAEGQAVTAEIGAGSAVILAAYAFLWKHSVKEPAALQGTVSALTVTTVLLGEAFGWWSLSDPITQKIVTLVSLVVLLLLVIFNRSVAWSPESVQIEVAKAQTPAAVFGAINPKLIPPSTETGTTTARFVIPTADPNAVQVTTGTQTYDPAGRSNTLTIPGATTARNDLP